MKIRNIPLDQVQVPQVRITAIYDEELLAQLRLSLGQLGQLQPIIVLEREGVYLLVDGLHRLQEAQVRGDKTIPAVLHQGDEADAILFNLVSARLRGKPSVANLVQVIRYLTGDLGLDSVEIARRTGLTRDYVERLWRISEACEEVQDALEREAISVAQAYELARLPHPDQQRKVLPIVERYKLPAKEIAKTVDDTLGYMAQPAPIQPTPQQLPRPLPHCEGCGQAVNPARLQGILLCPRCFGQVYQQWSPSPVPSSSLPPAGEKPEGG